MRRINRLPGRQQRRKLGKLNQLYLCVIGVLVNGVEGAKCTCVSHRADDVKKLEKRKEKKNKKEKTEDFSLHAFMSHISVFNTVFRYMSFLFLPFLAKKNDEMLYFQQLKCLPLTS